MDSKPNPGSSEADAIGCTCPVLDNRRGKGAGTGNDGEPLFWIDEACPVHNENPFEDEK